jgi:hypothetical protein
MACNAARRDKRALNLGGARIMFVVNFDLERN